MIRVLQLGSKDWNQIYSLPEDVELTYREELSEIPRSPYDIVFVERTLRLSEIELMQQATKAHTLYFIEDIKITDSMNRLFMCKKGKWLQQDKIQEFLLTEVRNYFPNPYGEKFHMDQVAIAQGFTGSVTWDGNYSVTVEGDFGENLRQIIYWRNNIPVFAGQAIDLWLEYEKTPGVEIALTITQFRKGSISTIQQKWEFSEKDLQEIVTIDNQMETGPVFVSLRASGKGRLKLVALHDRYSRRGHGIFLPGGERHVTSKKEEIFYYFDPGDMKPPLNVYFSGYKTMQGFEGYYMMRKMGSPFLLIGEPRLSGGAFYMGDKEYEKAMVDIICKHMTELGFDSSKVILSGMSMGTYGALYYGCDIRPHAMILGKPLASIGDVAANERLKRPGGFGTSLDVLQYLTGAMDSFAVQNLNERFWKKFDATNWSKSKFVVSYMIEDDYDSTAYNELISHLKSDGVQVYGKGIHGRHNDATQAIAGWFKNQYEQIMQEDFNRKIGK